MAKSITRAFEMKREAERDVTMKNDGKGFARQFCGNL